MKTHLPTPLEDDSAGICLKQETDDSDSDDSDAQPLAEAFGMGSGEAATATDDFFFLFPASQKRLFPRGRRRGKTEFPRLSELFLT